MVVISVLNCNAYHSFDIFSAKDPEYFFKKKLKEKDTGYTNRSLKLKCILNSADAKISWQKAGIKIPVSAYDISLILVNYSSIWNKCPPTYPLAPLIRASLELDCLSK